MHYVLGVDKKNTRNLHNLTSVEVIIIPRPPKRGHLAMMLSDVCLSVSLSDVCLSVAYIGPKSRTERPRKTKIGTEVAHVTRYSDTTFKVKRHVANHLSLSDVKHQ